LASFRLISMPMFKEDVYFHPSETFFFIKSITAKLIHRMILLSETGSTNRKTVRILVEILRLRTVQKNWMKIIDDIHRRRFYTSSSTLGSQKDIAEQALAIIIYLGLN